MQTNSFNYIYMLFLFGNKLFFIFITLTLECSGREPICIQVIFLHLFTEELNNSFYIRMHTGLLPFPCNFTECASDCTVDHCTTRKTCDGTARCGTGFRKSDDSSSCESKSVRVLFIILTLLQNLKL